MDVLYTLWMYYIMGVFNYLYFGNFAVETVSADSTTASDSDETVCYSDSGDDSDDESDGPLFVEDNSSEEEDLNFPN